MVDIIGREVKIGDLVFFEKSFYIVVGEDKLYKAYDNFVDVRSDFYLVAAPVEKELQIKKSLCNDYTKYMQEQLKKKEEQTKKSKEDKKKAKVLQRGDVVKKEYQYYLYLGLIQCADLLGNTYEGHGYIPIDIHVLEKSGNNVDLINRVLVKELFDLHELYLYHKEDKISQANKLLMNKLKIYKNKAPSFSDKTHYVTLIGNKFPFSVDCYWYELTGNFHKKKAEVASIMIKLV